MARQVLLLLCAALSVCACKKSNQNGSNTNWVTLPENSDNFLGVQFGHSHFVKLAVQAIKDPALHRFWTQDSSQGEPEALTRGNFLSDAPLKVQEGEADILQLLYRGVSDPQKWIGDYSFTDVHFTRAQVDGKPLGPEENCQRSLGRMQSAMQLATQFLRKGETIKFLNLVGHVTHMIQDGFASAHTRRLGSDVRILRDICTYKFIIKRSNGETACIHEGIDPRDVSTEGPEERAAVDATTLFLTDIGAVYTGNSEANWDREIATALNRFLTDRSDRNSLRGSFVCTDLRSTPNP